MAKEGKLQVKNTQLAEAINLSGLKAKLKKRTGSSDQATDSAHEESGSLHAIASEATEKTSPTGKSKTQEAAAMRGTAAGKPADSGAQPEIVFSTLEEKKPTEKSIEKRGEVIKEAPARVTESSSESKKAVVETQSTQQPPPQPQTNSQTQPQVSTPVQPAKKIPTLPLSMREGFSSSSRLGPVAEAPAKPVEPARSVQPRTQSSEQYREGGERRPFGDRPQGDRPPYAGGERRPFGDRPQGDRPPYEGGERRPFGDRPPREGGERRPFGDRPPGDRPPYAGGERRPFGDRPPREGGERRPFGDRPQGDRPPYAGGERRPFGDRPQGDRPPYEGGERRPFGDRPPREGGERRPFGDRPQGDRPPYAGGERRPFGDRPQGDRPPYAGGERRPFGDRPPRDGGERRPFGDRPQGDRPPREGGYQGGYRGERSDFNRPFTPRPPREGGTEGGARPFEPFRDRARGVQPFTSQSRPFRPRTEGGERAGGDRPFGDRPAGERFGESGRPPRGEFNREGGGRYEGSRPFTRSGDGGYGPRGPARPGQSHSGFSRPDFRPSALPAKESSKELVREFGPVRQRPEKSAGETEESKRKGLKAKDAKDSKLIKRPEDKDDARIRHGWAAGDETEESWRKKRSFKGMKHRAESIEPVRPQAISVRLPISLKELADKMKLKAGQIISKLFLQGMVLTLNDVLDDETTVQLLGEEFGCLVSIDTKEQEKMQVTDKSLAQEITATDPSQLEYRPPIVAFMGHVDHGKTSLIDAIRKSDRAQFEVGAITQHIGAFQCTTAHGPITILDTPGHEAFSNMRERGAEITDIVVLVVAGDEGMKEQTIEALNQARQSKSTIVVAINKCDKPAFDQEKVYRQLSEQELLPEAWGGQTVTVNCSAVTGTGVATLLEMLALQAEVLELKANASARARGRVIESQMQKGMGSVATLLIQNGTLHKGDCLVFDSEWAKVKTMRDELGVEFEIATPSAAVLITGLSGLPSAGEEFIVVSSEKEAKEITSLRQEGRRTMAFQKKRMGVESQMQSGAQPKKVLSIILRADVQGSLEAMKNALEKIKSDKVELNIFSAEVGEVSESDIQLAAASKATILGFHTQVESHAEQLIKQTGVIVKLHDIIYHAVDDIRDLMRSLLDKLVQENDKGKAEVKTIFRSSHLGIIAGCQVLDGTISRNCHVRIKRQGEQLWRGAISSLKRFKDDVREVQKGLECGVVLQGYSELQPGDTLEAYEVTYIAQDL